MIIECDNAEETYTSGDNTGGEIRARCGMLRVKRLSFNGLFISSDN